MDTPTQRPVHARYPTIRSGGLFVTLMGFTVLLASLGGGATLMQPGVFFGGLAVASILSFGVFWQRLSLGTPSAAQSRASRTGLVLEAVLLIAIWLILGQGDPRTLWLAVFLGVGAHFLVFHPVHGPAMVVLSMLCMANALVGFGLWSVPFVIFGAIDGMLKIAVGLRMLAHRPASMRAGQV